MWLLIVVTTFFAHSSNDPSNFAFETFNSKERCEEIAKWINTTYGPKSSSNGAHAQCVFKEQAK